MGMESNEVEGWKKARNHNRGKRHEKSGSIEKGGRREEGKSTTTTFFVTKFDDKWEARDLYHEFKELGDIDEVFIPNKKTRWGKKYGFARFFNVGDERVLEMKLDNLFLDGRKIFANLPKFGRRPIYPSIYRSKPRDAQEVYLSVQANTKVKNPSGIKGVKKGVSFAEVLKGETSTKVLEFTPDNDILNSLSKAYVGEVGDPASTLNMQAQFYAEGFFSIKCTSIGANLCLLEDENEGVLKEMVEGGSAWLGQWFKEVRAWSPREVDKERVAWVRVFGVPCQAWTYSFFNLISQNLGILLKEDEETKNRKRMDVARILIRTKTLSLINEEFKVRIGEDLYNIFMANDVKREEEVRNRNNIHYAYDRNVESSSESSVNESEKDVGDMILNMSRR
ncbi:uncharacterized protein LOC131613268 [Vicia villosa]|uniref:uncharacterized protein LOC131613268 n=1 Tax=Vicia villosa TaxID=3911 RepID=UPI00273B0CDB|nr:uncharacterized protein LOC131613268 [Vicia villosa]